MVPYAFLRFAGPAKKLDGRKLDVFWGPISEHASMTVLCSSDGDIAVCETIIPVHQCRLLLPILSTPLAGL
jgi:hypothetical protein